ncbi:MAG: histidinol-phosphatase HisJ family protein, partial [Butyrivibrio sp.]|nr:histidinol-phosphatase HisJ family protein [Butyrivibrio sp.]
MSITADYHLHSHHSGDSEAPMADMADAALARGLTEICFTEHEDLDFPDSADGPGSIFLLDAATYRSEWETLHPQYAGRLDIRFGVELGLQPHLVEQNRSFLTAQPYDFVIGSVHIADRRDPYYPDFYEGRTLQEAYRAYFEDVLENIRLMPEIDVLGHMDYPVRYAPGG